MRSRLTVLALLIFFISNLSIAQTYYVSPSGSNSGIGSIGDPWLTIQYAINTVSPGSTIQLADGVYNESLNINKSNLTIVGNPTTPANVIINAVAPGFGSPLAGIYVTQSGVFLEGFTLIGLGQATNTNPRYGIHNSNADGNTYQNLVIQDFSRTGLNVTDSDNLFFNYVTAENNGGNGLGLRDITNSLISNITTNNNLWGGLRIQSHNGSITGIVILGTNNFQEDGSAPLYLHPFVLEQGNVNPAGPPIPITYGYSGLVDVTIQNTDFGFTLSGDDDEAPQYQRIHFYKTQEDVFEAAEAPIPTYAFHITTNRFIKDISTGELVVPPVLGIEAAINAADPGDVINVEDGTYQAFTINKPITLIGGPGAKIDHGSPAITVNSTGVIITGFTFDFDSPDYAIDVLNGAYDVDINLNRFLNVDGLNVGNGVRNQGTGIVNAINNYWNSNTGPTIGSNPGGVGNTVANTGGGTLNYSPWYLYSGAQLDSPADLAINVPITPNFQWSWPWLGAATYTIEIATDAGFTNLVYGPVPATSPHQLPLLDALDNSTQYYWRVTADDGFDVYSSVASFTTITVPPPVLNSPANYAVGVSVLPSFSWTGPAITYDFEIDDNSNFSSPIATYSGANTTFDFLPYVSTLTPVLENGTLYYWRVRRTTIDGTSSWAQREFTTVNAAEPIVTTLYPSGNTCNLAWYPSPYAAGLKYDVLLSTNPDMSGYITPASGLTTTNYILSGLTAGTTYYVQIISYTGNGPYVYYTFSNVNTFTTPGVPPVYLSYPTGGAIVYFNPATVYYYTGTYLPGLQYQVRYSLSSSVDGFGMLNSGASSLALTSNLFATLPLLTAGSTYYWQVRAYDGFTYGQWSSVESFVIYSSTPVAPIIPYPSYPTTGSIVYINPPTFYWYIGTYAAGLEFYVEWDDASDFFTPLGNSGWITNLYFTLPTNLTPGQTYYWHVKSRLAGPPFTESGYSATQTFDMAAAINGGAAQPYPVNPSGGISVGTPLASTPLSWTAFSAAVLEYQVRISPYSNTDGNGMLNHPTAVSSGWISGTTTTVGAIPFSLTAGATYYWQVRSRLQATPAVLSSWSYVTYFVTAAGSFAIVPMVASPSHGQPINSSSAILSWRLPLESETHLKYDVEYSKDAEFSNSEKVQDVNETIVNITGLEPKATYYWRVLSKNANGSISNYSDVGTFKTDASITNVEDIESIPTEFKLEQNYPNPFNPATRISYSLPKNSFVSLKVYDILGREVTTLVNQEMNAGSYSVMWNGENQFGVKVASGTYIYSIIASDFTQTKKMLLIK